MLKALKTLRGNLRDWMGEWGTYPKPQESIANIGFGNYLHFLWQQQQMTGAKDRRYFHFKSKHAQHPVVCRANSTDIRVFSQIFMFREYQGIDDAEKSTLIIDCGANVGYSASYFLSRFPQAQLIAVEPDDENFKVLQENLKPFGARAKAVNSAIWTHPTTLKMAEVPYRDGAEWSKQVRECQPGETGGFTATDIGQLLKDSGHDRISILKIDIEGAEAVIFAKGYEAWLDRVDMLVIELHDDSIFGNGPAVFNAAIKDKGFKLSTYGELTICKR